MPSAQKHLPVLFEPLLELAAVQPGERWVDCTLGRGGHAEGLLEAGAELWAFDQDPTARAESAERLERFGDRLHIIAGNFRDVASTLAAEGPFDGLIADLGVSSPQLDVGARGFSFTHNGPVDMRMNPEAGETALALLRRLEVPGIADVLRRLGEERFAGPIARALKAWAEGEGPHDTRGLAAAVSSALPKKVVAQAKKHPATKTFQALRIAVNDELGALDALLDALPEVLAPGGRALIISFHSLEDRRVKRAFAALTGRQTTSAPGRRGLPPPVDEAPPPCVSITPKPVRARPDELEVNPRSRSAVLRGVRRAGEG